ncbi:hypothetical protein V5O48_016702 [Marasmius crinis-equi]|uniref:NACHT domain-containing protein n=1 Tax=Marasmius crinis-equi TaxID=585013 RepID=A0ABR3ER08_9AGAR
MSLNTMDISIPQDRGLNVAAETKQGEDVYSGPTRIVLMKRKSFLRDPSSAWLIGEQIKAPRTDILGDTLEEFVLVVESSGGETLREAKWDWSLGGWPLGTVLIRGSCRTENMTIKLQRKEHLGVYQSTIASGQLTSKEVEAAIHACHNQLEISLVIQSQSVNGRRLPLIVEIDTPSLLPVWITSVKCSSWALKVAESPDGIKDKTLESLDLVFKSVQGETFRESLWNSSHELWDIGLPLLRGTASERLSKELRRKRRIGILYETLATVVLNLEELEQARKESKKEITKVFVLSRENKLNVGELVLAIQIGALDMPPTDIRRFALPPSVSQILENISVVTGVVDKLSELHPVAELAWLIASVPLQLLQSKRELDDRLVDLIETMSQVYGCATVKNDPLRGYGEFQPLFDTMIQESVGCFLFIYNYISKGHSKNIANAPRKVKEFTQTFRKLKGQFRYAQQYTTTVTTLSTKVMVANIDKKIDLHQVKAELGRELGNSLRFQLPSDLSRCLEKTRQHTMARILGWIESEGEGSLLWLSGIAGSGKTTVMATLHDSLTEVGSRTPLAAYVRFHRNDFSSPSKFVAALAYGLVSFDKLLGAQLAKSLDARPNIFQKPLKEQFESLIVEPLGEYLGKPTKKGRGRIVVMVDGLDECMEAPGGSDTFLDLLNLLSNPKTFANLPFLRFIVASRPEEPIRRRFARPEQNHVLHFPLDTSSNETRSDIYYYFHVKFEEIFQIDPDFEAFCLERNALYLYVLAERSSGLFIWAVTVLERIERALQLSLPQDSLDSLNKLYSTVLNAIAAEQGDQDIKAYMAPILGLIIAFGKIFGLRDTETRGLLLTPSILTALLNRLGYPVHGIPSVLSQLGSVIEGVDSRQSRLILLHKSFDDYLTDEGRAGEWFVDVKGDWSTKLAESCTGIVHSNIFSNKPDYSNLSFFTHCHWTFASGTQSISSDTSPPSELSAMFSDILHRGFLRWIYICTDPRRWGKMKRSYMCNIALSRFSFSPRITAHALEILQEIGSVYANDAVRLNAHLSEHLQILLLSMLRGEMPAFSKCYMSLFPQIIPSSQRKDFHTILKAISEISHSESADHMELFKPVPLKRDTTNFEPIVGIPDDEVLYSMLQDLIVGSEIDIDGVMEELGMVVDGVTEEEED